MQSRPRVTCGIDLLGLAMLFLELWFGECAILRHSPRIAMGDRSVIRKAQTTAVKPTVRREVVNAL